MSTERLGVVAILTCIAAAGLYTFAMPQSGAAPERSTPSVLATNVALAAHMSPLGQRREVVEEVSLTSLSRGAQKVVEACRDPLRRRGMSTGEGSNAMKACVCVANKLDASIGDSDDAMKLAGYFFDPLFEPERKNRQVTVRFVKKAKRHKRGFRKVHKAVTRAVRSGCHVGSKLGIQLSPVTSVLIYPPKWDDRG